MQQCSKCNTTNADTNQLCTGCGAELREFSTTAVTLKSFKENERVNLIHLAAPADACPACMAVQGTYPKDKVPALPVEGCSCVFGCTCYYQPLLESIFP
ncbi:MAG: hypothetical protein HY835_03070 [Anaerolineae bacterium]|nr:hypothetical protein [Anaerolineae bacterium]